MAFLLFLFCSIIPNKGREIPCSEAQNTESSKKICYWWTQNVCFFRQAICKHSTGESSDLKIMLLIYGNNVKIWKFEIFERKNALLRIQCIMRHLRVKTLAHLRFTLFFFKRGGTQKISLIFSMHVMYRIRQGKTMQRLARSSLSGWHYIYISRQLHCNTCMWTCPQANHTDYYPIKTVTLNKQ